MPSADLLIPGYTIARRDAKTNKNTCLLTYISDAIFYKHLSPLDQPGVEAVWLETGLAKSTSILVGYSHRNPTLRVSWMDAFTAMMDTISFESNEIILLGDFNMHLQKANNRWKNNLDTYNLHPLVKSPTRVTQNSKTLIDHI